MSDPLLATTTCSLITPSGIDFPLTIRPGDVTTVSIGGLDNTAAQTYEAKHNRFVYVFAKDDVRFELDVRETSDERGAKSVTLYGTRERGRPMIVAFGSCGREVQPPTKLVDLKIVDLLDRTSWPDHCLTLSVGRKSKSIYGASAAAARYQDDDVGAISMKRAQIQLPGPFEGNVSFHISFVGVTEGKMDPEIATVDAASGEAVIAITLTKNAHPKIVSSRYVICGSKSVKVGS
ncbi:hypothetical protein [Sphingomonas sp. LT1P40]|uniref:hypothetical protein n=1 Tax=Alteristakelama amylovorans TaxID=3096166 RepID=UPI002FC593A0